ncbi:TonB family protein [Pseudomonas savastanoi pv. phaseolicola]|uniref:TonB domain-containing protein n=4 Tax=Pseudomonas savastanoi TaxID=29438 RepID=A0A3M3HTL6_PSESG|nr:MULTISPECIES: energy transducer TonB [Pseudomonas]AAZ36649.1 tonB domain protein [Pseudomonas savastanoi pv. phaseolicola 1448A]EFW80507.1 TonB domain-containing protein [Pseudomonas savastanoi pv. glycinea str. B076]EFW84167.1 TonB domain-containing protein [Pseudomonas savastanoi pv. glycinea str. race 4]KPB41459.1 TonB domain-containing protein [Pseudomonas savastanoi pv. phaseolicola]KPB42149.1 TonB domain-containing protein [Pseudomonas savastanoi pv. phaseolicola]
MPALLLSRRPPQPCRDDLLPALPAGRFDAPAVPLPAIAVPRIGMRHVALACVIALAVHAAGFLWFRNSAPAQPLPPITRPMPIAMQMVARPTPPAPATPAAAAPAVEQPTAPPPVIPAEPAKPLAAAPKPETPRPQPAKPQAKPQQKAQQQVAEKQAPAAAPQSIPAQQPMPAPPASSEPPATAPIGRAGYLNNPPPVYPPAAAKRHQQGTTLLRVHVLASGRPDQIEVAQSSGFSALDDAARAAVRQWSFTPAKRGNSPVDGWVNVPLAFTLAP